ncbi:glutaminyl-peptide cyclotransferase [Xylariaceae sp. FL0804]|nr:glutaminyl-peptide cyclotransferase [Xylariaceae sp. FL0804]
MSRTSPAPSTWMLARSLAWPRPAAAALSPLLAVLFCAALLVLLGAPAPARAYAPLSDAALRGIADDGGDLDPRSGSLLAPILVPRVPGTPGSAAVQRHLAGFFAAQLPRWRAEWHNSTARPPSSLLTAVSGDADVNEEVPFSSLVVTRDPPWAARGDVARLVLAAHYDSLPGLAAGGFVGATDSAAPCAVLLQAARAVDDALTRRWAAMEAEAEAAAGGGDAAALGLEEEKGVQIVFLDGEEAWATWSEADSLYGARALAEHWDAEPNPPLSTFRTPLESISLFVLLDLLGAPDPHVPSYFPSSHWAYQAMAEIEARMRRLGLLASKPRSPFLPESQKRANQFRAAFVQDDHVPFMVRGVNVLHLIPTPFPDVWHTMDDDADHLDAATVSDWAKIVAAFAAEWMEQRI